MATYRVHQYKEFSQVVEVEADSYEEALEKYNDGEWADNPDDWEASGDEYASAITGPNGQERSLKDGELS